MDVAGVSASNNSGSLAGAAASQMGKDDFLLLLVTQLRYQDPLNPMENTEFVSQLAQFSSLEQMENLNTKFDDQAVLVKALNNTMAVSYVGKEVVLASNELQISEDQSARFGVHLGAAADNVSVTIRDAAGDPVRVLDLGGLSRGSHELGWDGRDAQGNVVPEGRYTIRVAATDASGGELSASPVVIGAVQSLVYENGTAYFTVGGARAPLAALIEVLDAGSGAGESTTATDPSTSNTGSSTSAGEASSTNGRQGQVPGESW